jgi:hypothetical protein
MVPWFHPTLVSWLISSRQGLCVNISHHAVCLTCCVWSCHRNTAGFRISLTGLTIEVMSTTNIVKKLKLVGTPSQIHKNTAYIKGTSVLMNPVLTPPSTFCNHHTPPPPHTQECLILNWKLQNLKEQKLKLCQEFVDKSRNQRVTKERRGYSVQPLRTRF